MFCAAIASLPPSLHHSHLAMHHHHHHNALIPNGLAMSSNLNNNSIQTNNNNLTNKLTHHQSTNSSKNNNTNDTENHRNHTDNKTDLLSSNNSSSNSPNHLSSRPVTPGICRCHFNLWLFVIIWLVFSWYLSINVCLLFVKFLANCASSELKVLYMYYESNHSNVCSLLPSNKPREFRKCQREFVIRGIG